jgi:autotransporter-associated beta strand protein
MKPCTSFFAALVVVVFSLTSVQAQLYWDTNAGTDGTTNPPNGTWNAANAFWNTVSGGTGTPAAWVAGQTAVFSAGTNGVGAFTVTISGAQTASGVTFEEGTATLTGDGLNLTGGTISVAAGLTSTIQSAVGGSVLLSKTGTGTLVVSGANTYSNGTTISAGTMRFATTSSMPASGTVAPSSGATLAVNAGGGSEWTNAASGNGSIGGLIAGTGGQGAPVVWASGSILGIDTTNAGGTLTYSNVIGSFNTGGTPIDDVILNKLGTGTLVLNAASTHTYTGATRVNGGTLQLGDGGTAGALSTSSAIVTNATFAINQSDAVTQGTDFSAGPIAGSGNLEKAGSGTLTLNAPNTFSGTARAIAGALVLTDSLALQNATLNMDGTDTGSATFDNSLTSITLGGLAGSRNFSANSAVNITVGNGSNSLVGPYSGVLSTSGTVTKEGTGTQILSGLNTYGGGSNVNMGTLQFGKTFAMPVSGDVTVNSGATLAVNAGGTDEWANSTDTSTGGTIGSLMAGRGGQGTANQVAWNVGSNMGIDTTNAPGGTLTYGGVIGSFRTTTGTTNAVGLTKRGTGTLVLNTSHTYTGNTTMATNSGTLRLAAMNTVNPNTVIVLPPSNGSAIVELFDGGTPYSQTVAGISGGGSGTASPTIIDIGFATLTVDVPTGQSHTYNGYLKTAFTDPVTRGKVIKKGQGDLTLGGLNNNATLGMAGEFSLEEGRLLLTNNVGIGGNTSGLTTQLTLKGGTLVRALADTNTGMTIGPRTLEIAGDFTFDMNGSTGNAQILPSAPGSGLGGINLTANSTVNVTGGVDTFPTGTPTGFTPTFILSGIITDGAASRSLTKEGPGTLTLDRVNTYDGGTIISEGIVRLTLAVGGSVGSTMGTGPVTLAGGGLEYTGALISGGRTLTVDNAVTMTQSSTITLRGGSGASGLSTLGVDFVFSNITATAGTLTLQNNGNSNEPNAGNPIQNPVEFRVGFTSTALNFTRPIDIKNHATITNRTTVLRSANASGTQTFSGVISGNGGLKRDAGGTTELTAANTYSGGTTVVGGTLEVNGSSATLGTGNVNVNAGTLNIMAGVANAIANSATLGILNPGQVVLGTGINDVIAMLNLDNGAQLFTSGTFGSVASGALNPGLVGNPDDYFSGMGTVTVTPFVPGLPGDYNEDQVVDAADYVMWRKRNPDPTGPALPNDDTAGVDTDDYDRWEQHFGEATTGSGGNSGASGQVPEPTSVTIALLAIVAAGVCRRRQSYAGFCCY